MATQTDNRVEYRTRWYSYYAPCGVEQFWRNTQIACLTERVESYRGKPLYIDVCSKRRKVFHEFTRWRHSAGEQSSMFWCPPGSTRAMYAQDFPYAQLISYCDPAIRAAYPTYWSGDYPLMIESQLSEYGEELREFVIRDLFAKANSPRFEGAVFLAELGETLTGIHKLLKGCAGSLLKTGQAWKHLKHFSLNSEELWLWWRYMLMPTMMEVESMIEALEPQMIVDRVQDGDRYKEPKEVSGVFYSHKWFASSETMTIPWRSKIRFGSGGAIDMHARDNRFDFGLSPWDTIRGAWEAIPFSFVVDWFVNVGDWLASLRDLEVVYAQSYATYAVDVETEVLQGDDMTVDTQTARSFLMSRIVNLEPPSLPLIDRRWMTILRTIDGISLILAILKGVTRKHRYSKYTE